VNTEVGSARRCREVVVAMDDGVKLAVRDYGRPEAERTVVFVHGLCLSQMCWGVRSTLWWPGSGTRFG
jgi:hypothetical protein